jgi:hypothetical protein
LAQTSARVCHGNVKTPATLPASDYSGTSLILNPQNTHVGGNNENNADHDDENP